MINFVLISPHFPSNYWLFARALKNRGVRVLGIVDTPVESLPEALRAVARKTIERKTGARGLRGVLENVMTDIMFSIPSDKTVSSVTITPEVVMGTGEPVVEHDAMPVDPEPPKKRTRKTTKSA